LFHCTLRNQKYKQGFFRNKSGGNKSTEIYKECKSIKNVKKEKKQSVHLAKMKMNFNMIMVDTDDRGWLNAVSIETVASYCAWRGHL
jgi:hypothetical protein